MIATLLFEGSTDSVIFNDWLVNHLFKELPSNATVIMDNAPFHKKNEIEEIFKNTDFNVMFLPPYSPDFNPIEQDFAVIKKQRIYSEKSLDEIVKVYRS